MDESIGRLNGIDGRKVVLVVFTDGEDTASKLGAGKVVKRARAEDVMGLVGLINDKLQRPAPAVTNPDRGLSKPRAETGGGFFLLKSTDELGSDVHPHRGRTSQPGRARFRPGSDGWNIDKLEVRLKKVGLEARARRATWPPPRR